MPAPTGISFLRGLLTGFRTVAIGGVAVTAPNGTPITVLNIPSGASGAYNAATGALDLTISAQFTPGGDISGSASSQEVIGILSQSLPALSTGSLSYTGSAWEFITAYPLTAGGACSVSFAATVPASLNLSTSPLGARDWFTPGGVAAINYRGVVTCHSKILGASAIRNSFDWVGPASGNVATNTFGAAGRIPLTTVAGDDQWQAVLSGSATGQEAIDGTNAALGWGYAFRVPADTFARTLTIYGGQFSCDVTLTATASDGSFVAVTSTQTVGANAQQGQTWTVTYNTARDGQFVTIEVLCTTNHANTPNIEFQAALLS